MFWRKKLLCQFDRNNVLDFLRKEDGYSLDKVLCVTKEYAILDATAYLLVRTGNVTEAVNLLVLDMAESMSETKLSALVDLISSIDDEKQWFHATANLDAIDPSCGDLDYIRNESREIDVDYVMSNNFAFGGINTSLIFKRWT